MARIAVLGAGMMGSALCVPLVDRGHDVRLIGTHLDADIVTSLRGGRVHPKLRLELPSEVRAMPIAELAEGMRDVDVIALGVSSAGIGWACERIRPHVRAGRPVFMITKGLGWDGQSLEVLPDVVARALPEELRGVVHPAAIAGPCIAGELARRVETCVVITSRDVEQARALAELLRTPYYHPSVSADVTGVEVCAALKNAFAMGVAFGAGIHAASGGEPGSIAMHNYESAVFAQAVLEMRRVVRLLGGDEHSAAGLAGAGDLDVTNNGGRTGRFGRFLGRGMSRDEAVLAMDGATLECLDILRVMREATASLTARGQLEPGTLPLLEHLAEVGLDGAPVSMPFERFFQ